MKITIEVYGVNDFNLMQIGVALRNEQDGMGDQITTTELALREFAWSVAVNAFMRHHIGSAPVSVEYNNQVIGF